MFKKKPPPSQPGGGRSSMVEPEVAPERPPKPGAKPKVATPPPHDDDEMDDGVTLYNELTDIANEQEQRETVEEYEEPPDLYEETTRESTRSYPSEPDQETTYEDTSEMEKMVPNRRNTMPPAPTSAPPKKDDKKDNKSKGKNKSVPDLPGDSSPTTDSPERKRPPGTGVSLFCGVSINTIKGAKSNLRKVPSVDEKPKSPESEEPTSPFPHVRLKSVTDKPHISPKPAAVQNNSDKVPDWAIQLRKSISKSPPVSPRSPTSGPTSLTAAAPPGPPPLPNRPSPKASSPVHVQQNGSPSGPGASNGTANETELEEDTYTDGFSLIEPLSSMDWFHGCLSREDAEAKLRATDKNGAYLVRKTDKNMPYKEKPYLLSVLARDNVYNLILRQRNDEKYAIGNEKPDELAFDSVEDLLKFHETENLVLIRNGGQVFTVLTSYPPAKR